MSVFIDKFLYFSNLKLSIDFTSGNSIVKKCYRIFEYNFNIINFKYLYMMPYSAILNEDEKLNTFN